MDKVCGFSGEFRFLSNFWPAVVELDGVKYSSVEHAFQAAKCVNIEDRKSFLSCTASQAKRLGRQVDVRPDWNDIRVAVMTELVREKFAVEPLRSKLIALSDTHLEETNTWKDTFWGVCDGVGQNYLGRILMLVCLELQCDCCPPASLVIFGSRSFTDYDLMSSLIKRTAIWKSGRVKSVISGKAAGADTLGEDFAKANGLEIIDRPADWDNLEAPGAVIKTGKNGRKYNARAGFDRNHVMAQECTHAIGFWDGISGGTNEMANYCASIGKTPLVYNYIDNTYEIRGKK